ncbi:hypothetical protein BHM03_00037671, partial [Ensete ventricosum]
PVPFAGATLQATVSTGDCRPYELAVVGRARGRLLPPRVALLPAGTASTGCYPCGQLSPLAGAAGLPFGLAFAAAGRPLVGGLGSGVAGPARGLTVVGRPSSSLPLLRKCNKNM